MPRYKVSNFRKKEIIGVIGRGSSLGHIDKYHTFFQNSFIAGIHVNSFRIINNFIRGYNFVQVAGSVFPKPYKGLIDFIHDYRIKDLQTSLVVKNPSKKERLEKIRKQYKKLLTVHTISLPFMKRNFRFCNNLVRKRPTHPTSGLLALNLACAFKPKKIFIIGIDFYCSPYFVREKDSSSIGKNRRRKVSMIEYFCELCKYEPKIQFNLFTCCKEIIPTNNLIIKYLPYGI